MDKAKELDIVVAAAGVSRAIAEIIYCSIEPQITGPYRIQEAHKTFGEAVLNLVKVIQS